MKRIFSCLLALVLLLALFPAVTSMATGEGDLYYNLDADGNAAITDYTGAGGAVTIPATIDGYTVTSIWDYAFDGNDTITSVTIPNSVTKIGDGAFYHCTALTSVTIPNSVTFIDNGAFYGCTSLANVTIPNSVTAIGKEAFGDCDALTSITLPNSVTAIGKEAFGDCDALTSITIPGSVATIEKSTFTHCNALASVTISNNLTDIPESLFYGCTALPSVTIPDGVGRIVRGAFYECTALTSVTIPDSVTTIDCGAFYSCTSLANVTIPDSVTTIKYGAFALCSALTSVVIPNSVEVLGIAAFTACSSLKSALFLGAPPTIDESVNLGIVETPVFGDCATGFTIYYDGRQAAAWAPNGETTWTEPITDGATYNITPLPALLGAQAYTDGSKFRFAFEIDRAALQAALEPGETLQIGYNVRSKANYESDGILSTVLLPAVTWTAAMDAATTGTALKELLYTAYYGAGMRIFSADADSLTFALVLTGMSDKQSTDIVFTGFFTTPKISMRGILKYNSIQKVLAGTASTVTE